MRRYPAGGPEEAAICRIKESSRALQTPPSPPSTFNDHREADGKAQPPETAKVDTCKTRPMRSSPGSRTLGGFLGKSGEDSAALMECPLFLSRAAGLGRAVDATTEPSIQPITVDRNALQQPQVMAYWSTSGGKYIEL